MRSMQKTTTAVVRSQAGLSLNEFAELIGKSPDTVASLEGARLALSERTALEISRKTGVSCAWLTKGDQKAPAIDVEGKPWTHKSFETCRARSARQGKLSPGYKVMADQAAERVRKVVRDQAYNRDCLEIVTHRISSFLWKLELEFPPKNKMNGGMER